MPSDCETLLAQFKDTSSDFDINVSANRMALSKTLDAIAEELARDQQLRQRLGSQDLSIWTDVRKLWRDLVRAQLTFWDGDDDSDAEEERTKQQSLGLLCISLARFTRNLVAGIPPNQKRAYENEPEIRRLIHYYTSWSSMQDENATFAARLLTQTLSNLVTGNDTLMHNLWETYLNLPEDQVVIIRLLSSPDKRTVLAVLMLINNCIQESKTRTKMLTRTAIGGRICVCLLDNMVKLYDCDENSDGGKAFDIGYLILSRFLDLGLVPELYQKLSMQGEVVTPHQTTLMKIVDSYLQSTPADSPHSSPSPSRTRCKLVPMLSNCFLTLSSYAQNAIRRALRPSRTEVLSPTSASSFSSESSDTPPAELDVMLPKVCETLVLATQCIVSILLATQQSSSPEATSPRPSDEWTQVFYKDHLPTGPGFTEHIIELLRLLDKFLPRINFGRPVESSSTASSPSKTQQSSPASTAPGSIGFSYLKRDLVRLLGILSHDNKSIQERVRMCGGIEVVLNLCVVDERNPYLREHAIFTLHNLLKGNPANQAVVEEIKPMGQWDENGQLKDIPNAVRR